MLVVGLTGKAGSGKSEVANYLVEAHGFTKLSFAGPLKKMLRTLDPLLFSDFDDQTYRLSELFDGMGRTEGHVKEYFPEYRRLLQVLGTDCIRAVDEDFWVRAAMKQLTDLDGRYVFDDVRFPNEARAVEGPMAKVGSWNLHSSSRSLWHIERPNNDADAGAHESEQYAGKLGETLTITNYSSKLGPLHEQIDYTMAQVFGGVPA